MADKGEDLNLQLLKAASECDLEQVKTLLSSGADAKFIHDPPGTWGAKNRKGPLHGAIRAGARMEQCEAWKALVKTLVEAGADVNGMFEESDWRGCGSSGTAFELILPYAMEDAELLELFLKAGSDPNTCSVRHVHSMRTDGKSVKFVLHNAVCQRKVDIVRALLDAGANVDAVASEHFNNERGFNTHLDETALHQACGAHGKEPDLAVCALLLARGANVNAVRNNLEQVSSGLESPTDDPRDQDFVPSVRCVPVRETALHLAIMQKKANLIVMLVCAGAERSVMRKFDDESMSCEDLCKGDDDLLTALKTEWTPENHKHFPGDIKESVEAALKVAKRQNWPLPETVLFRVCALSASA